MSDEICEIGLSGFIIDPDGNILICRNMEAIGNIKDDLPEAAWNSKKADEIRKRIALCAKSCRILSCNTFDHGKELN